MTQFSQLVATSKQREEFRGLSQDQQEAVRAYLSVFNERGLLSDGNKWRWAWTFEIAARMYHGIDTSRARLILQTLSRDIYGKGQNIFTTRQRRGSNDTIGWALVDHPGWVPGKYTDYVCPAEVMQAADEDDNLPGPEKRLSKHPKGMVIYELLNKYRTEGCRHLKSRGIYYVVGLAEDKTERLSAIPNSLMVVYRRSGDSGEWTQFYTRALHDFLSSFEAINP